MCVLQIAEKLPHVHPAVRMANEYSLLGGEISLNSINSKKLFLKITEQAFTHANYIMIFISACDKYDIGKSTS